MSNTIITLENLLVGYRKKSTVKIVCSPINLSLKKGEFVCMLGPNGSGKTTLLKTLCGVQKPIDGDVKIHSKSLSKYSSVDLSKLLSIVLTEKVSVGNLDVYSLVSLGRYPYTNWLGGLTNSDKKIIEWALEETQTKKFAHRHLGELSDGELQKVMIARSLAQDTEIILLDEPTAHLDLPNRVEIFQLLRKLAMKTKKLILLSTHELDLSLQSADKIWLINSDHEVKAAPEIKGIPGSTSTDYLGNEILAGTPEDLVISGAFQKAFQANGLTFDQLTGQFKVNADLRFPVNLHGAGMLYYWTSRALGRLGYYVDNTLESELKISINGLERSWQISSRGEHQHANSIEELLKLITESLVLA